MGPDCDQGQAASGPHRGEARRSASRRTCDEFPGEFANLALEN